MRTQGRGLWEAALVAGAAALVFVACGGGGQSSVAAARLPLDFQVSVYQGQDILGGKELRFSDMLARGRPVVLNFWAGLCPPCRAEMPDLQQMYDQYKDRLLLFGLDVGPFVRLGSWDDGRALLRELGITYPAGTTVEPKVVQAYEILAMPTTLFIKPNGEVVKKWTGLLTRGKMTELVEELLAASAKG